MPCYLTIAGACEDRTELASLSRLARCLDRISATTRLKIPCQEGWDAGCSNAAASNGPSTGDALCHFVPVHSRGAERGIVREVPFSQPWCASHKSPSDCSLSSPSSVSSEPSSSVSSSPESFLSAPSSVFTAAPVSSRTCCATWQRPRRCFQLHAPLQFDTQNERACVSSSSIAFSHSFAYKGFKSSIWSWSLSCWHQNLATSSRQVREGLV